VQQDFSVAEYCRWKVASPTLSASVVSTGVGSVIQNSLDLFDILD